MRIVPIILLCLLATACERTDSVSAGPPAVTPGATPAAAAAPPATPGPVELTPDQVAATPLLSSVCNLEYVDDVLVPDGNPIEAKSRSIRFSGWLVDDVKRALPASTSLRIYSTSGDGRAWQFPVTQQLERADVQALQGGAPELLKSGFEAQVDLSALDAGNYSLRLAYERDGALVLCDNGRAVVLK